MKTIYMNKNLDYNLHMREPVLITGTPRSGTEALAKDLGLSHEHAPLDNGGVSYKHVMPYKGAPQVVADNWTEETGGSVAFLSRDPLLTVMSLEDVAVVGSHIPRLTMRRVVHHADGADAEQRMVTSHRLMALWYWVVVYERWANGNPQWPLIRLEDLRFYEDRYPEANTRDVCASWMVREAPAALVGRLLTLCDRMGYTDARGRIEKAAARAIREPRADLGSTLQDYPPGAAKR